MIRDFVFLVLFFVFPHDLGRFMVRAPRHRRLDSLVADRGRDLTGTARSPRIANGIADAQKFAPRFAAFPTGSASPAPCQNAAFCPAGSSTVTWQLY